MGGRSSEFVELRSPSTTPIFANSTVFSNNIGIVINSEAFLIRKIPYGDADYVLTLFTRDYGKIAGFAKHARKSRKRFGGRLEPFIQFRVRMKDKSRDMYFIEDADTIRVYHSFMENIELFLWGSFMLESLDALLPKDSPNEELFEILVNALRELDEGMSVLPVVLEFQLRILSASGYEPNFEMCSVCDKPVEGEARFSVERGGVVCGECSDSKKGIMVSGNILRDRESMEMNLSKVLQYIKLFTTFTEYHTERKLKTSQFIEELRT